MAFDPIEEDCARLVLASLQREHISLADNPLYADRCVRAYRKDPASLISTDHDRSFHLVAKAAEIADYRLPFVTNDDELDRQADLAEQYLQEAGELDGENWDAKRMLAALDADSNEEYLDYLLKNKDTVEKGAVYEPEDKHEDKDVTDFAKDLARRPYLRWLAAISSRAFIAGRYRLSYETAEESLAFEPSDPADVRHTAMLALSKLESTPEELSAFHARHETAYKASASRSRRRRRRNERDAWWIIAEMNVTYRNLDFEGANALLGELMRVYPKAAEPLYYQAELPEGLYSRLNVEPKSEDELILALSEATPILQEGYGAPDSASFSLWIAENEQVQNGLDTKSSRFEAYSNTRRTGGEN